LCAKPNEPRDYRLQKWLEWLGDSIAWDITEEQIDGLLEALSNAGMANSTRNRELGDIKAIFNWAIKEKRTVGHTGRLYLTRSQYPQTRRTHQASPPIRARDF
jgi:site-specific recombinase XerD